MFRRIFWPLLAALAAWVLWRVVRMRNAYDEPLPYPTTLNQDTARAYDQSIDTLLAGSPSTTTTVEELAANITPPDLLEATTPSTAETPLPDAADTDSLPPIDAPDSLADSEASTPAEPPEVQPIEQVSGDDVDVTPHVDEQTLDNAPGASAERQPVVPVSEADAAAEDTGEILTDLDVYCVRCREHRTLTNARVEITTRGRRAARGVCPVCGANVFTFLPQHD